MKQNNNQPSVYDVYGITEESIKRGIDELNELILEFEKNTKGQSTAKLADAIDQACLNNKYIRSYLIYNTLLNALKGGMN